MRSYHIGSYELGIPGMPGLPGFGVDAGLDVGTGFLPGDSGIPLDFGGYVPTDGGGGGIFGGLSSNIDSLLNTAVKGAGAYATVRNIFDNPSTFSQQGGTASSGAAGSAAPGSSILNQKYFGLTVPEIFILGAGLMLVMSAAKKR